MYAHSQKRAGVIIAAMHAFVVRLRVERESALNKLDNLEVRLAQAESFESTNLVAAKKDLQNYQDANTTLAAQNKDLSEELSAARHELR